MTSLKLKLKGHRSLEVSGMEAPHLMALIKDAIDGIKNPDITCREVKRGPGPKAK